MWEKLWPELVSGAFIVAGVVIAQRLSERAAARAAFDDAAAALGNAIGDLRDRSIHGRGARAGRYDLWPLRNELYRSRRALGGIRSSAYGAAQNFYDATSSLREWTRALERRRPDRLSSDGDDEWQRNWKAWERYTADLDALAEDARTCLAQSRSRQWHRRDITMREMPPLPMLDDC